MSAMDRVRAEQARRAEALKLIKEWHDLVAEVKNYQNARGGVSFADRLITAGDQLEASLVAATFGVQPDKENDSE